MTGNTTGAHDEMNGPPTVKGGIEALPPPGPGLATVITKSRTARWSAAGKTNVICDDDRKTVVRFMPEVSKAVELMNPEPVIVTTASDPPPGMTDVDSDVTTGAGLRTENG